MGIVRELVSNRTWNKNTRMKKYLVIADTEGFDRALEELEIDKKYGAIPVTSYYRIKDRLLELKAKAERRKQNFELLLLKFLTILAESDRERFTREDLARKLGVSVEVIDDFNKWISENGYGKIIRLVAIGKKAAKEVGLKVR